MKYRSTSRQCPEVTFREAVLRGLAEDGGLYVPAEIPRLERNFFERLPQLSFPELCVEVARPYLDGEIGDDALRELVAEAMNFPVPLVSLSPPLAGASKLHVLEMFHGPTLAFKDFGARFMARVMGHFVRGSGRELTVLVATSGDTGSAVAQGFFGVPGIRVVVLYPSGRVSEAQERQFTTLGGNITALEVAGAFDDCQRLVKQALADVELNEKLFLTSANSINIARLIPQTFYYFAAFAQLGQAEVPVVVSVPSGNFGNLTAGLYAKRTGLAASQFIAATNINDVVPEFLRSGTFRPRPSQQTLSSAMDVGNPSNFARLADLYENDIGAMRRDLWGCGFTDEETLRAMKSVQERFGYLADPHTAVGILGFETFLKQHSGPCQGIALATAHPAKFAEAVARATGVKPKLPERLAECLARPKKSQPLANSFEELKSFLLA
jgi:threonine synthase